MDDVQLRYGIPDVELGCPKGGTVNPTTFVGHQLIVVFLPADEAAALQELGRYANYADELTDSDAWVLGIVQQEHPSTAIVTAGHGLVSDPDCSAWRAFERLLKRGENHDRDDGAVYLFGRGGALQKAWFGSGVADDVVRELRRQASW